MPGKKEIIKTFFIVNPISAGGATMKRWPRTFEKLALKLGHFDYEFTNAAGVATMLANEAVCTGYEKIVAVGGDGTLHEVLQGLFEGGSLVNPDVLVGLLPSGTGTDFARTLKMSNDIDEAVVRLRGRRHMRIDIGQVDYLKHRGGEGTNYFINVADVGLGGEVAERANNSTRAFGGLATYLYSSVVSVASYKPKHVRIVVDGREFEEDVTSVFIGNGEFFGGGMHISPNSKVSDGLFEVIILQKLSKWEIVALAPKLYSGKILTIPGIKHFQAKEVRVESDEKVLINLDGEQPGTTPVTFKVLPQVLKFMV